MKRLDIYKRQAALAMAYTIRARVKKGLTVPEIEKILAIGFPGEKIDLKLDKNNFTITVDGKRIIMEY